MNIILNAIDAMPNGGTLIINTKITKVSNPIQNDAAKEFLRIDFLDNGEGIPLAILDNLFEPFIKGSDQGVGIGLSISQSIANSHGGWIAAANSSVGNGAIFKVFLPTQKDYSHV
jgi:two-component system cell cycle sensor histidine kinase/response regulator CckA